MDGGTPLHMGQTGTGKQLRRKFTQCRPRFQTNWQQSCGECVCVA